MIATHESLAGFCEGIPSPGTRGALAMILLLPGVGLFRLRHM